MSDLPTYIGFAYLKTSYAFKKTDFSLKTGDENKASNLCKRIFDKIETYAVKNYVNTQIYYHCEVLFPTWLDSDGQHIKVEVNGQEYEMTCLSFGVTTERGVFTMHRTFDNQGYSFRFLTVGKKELCDAYQFCKRQVGKKFDRYGAKRSIFFPVTANLSPLFLICQARSSSRRPITGNRCLSFCVALCR